MVKHQPSVETSGIYVILAQCEKDTFSNSWLWGNFKRKMSVEAFYPLFLQCLLHTVSSIIAALGNGFLTIDASIGGKFLLQNQVEAFLSLFLLLTVFGKWIICVSLLTEQNQAVSGVCMLLM